MARSSHDTLLSLDDYARIMTINPAHFNGGASSSIMPPKSNRCQDLWPQYGWQYYDHIGREELGEAIKTAEDDIAEVLGYYPAPKYISQEVHPFPTHHRKEVWRSYGLGARGQQVSITTNFAKVISAGQRNAATLVGTATVVGGTLTYDFAALTATIVLPTTLTDTCEVQAFFAGHSGAPEWEVRPFSSISISGGFVTIVLPSWRLIKPSLWEAYPTTTDFAAIDITNNANHEQTVEVRRVYTDTTVTSAVFYWEPRPSLTAFPCTACGGGGCAACTLTTQNGCFHLRDPELGIIVPTPATYSATDEAWSGACFSVCRDPDTVKVYYYAGDISERRLSSRGCNPLPEQWARTIAYLATARIERPFCECGAASASVVRAQRDLALSGGDISYNGPPLMLDNPFGTRWGEVNAWRHVSRVSDRVIGGGTW